MGIMTKIQHSFYKVKREWRDVDWIGVQSEQYILYILYNCIFIPYKALLKTGGDGSGNIFILA